MASLRVLAFDHEGRPVQFDMWLDDLDLYLLSDIKDGVSLFDHVFGAATAPPTTADSATRSQWLSRDAAALLAIRNHLPLAECAHFGQHRTPQALYDPVVACFSSPAIAALGRLLLPYLFPELSAFATVEDLTSTVAVGAARGTPRPPFFEGCSPSPLAPSYASAADADVSVAEDVGAASAGVKWRRGKGKGGKGGGGGSGGGGGGSGSSGGGRSGGGGGGGTGGGSGGSGGGGGGSGGSGGGGGSGTGGGGTGAQRVGSGGGQRQQHKRRSETKSPQSRIAIVDLYFDAILSAMYDLSVSAEGDCYRCVPPDPGIAAAALGASESGTLSGTAPTQALHTFTMDSGASACFFRDSTTLIPLSTPVPVRLADPSGGPVVARSSTVLLCPAVPSSSLSGLHLPSFSANLVSTTALQDAMVTTTTPEGQRVSIYTCTRTGRHMATFTRRPGSSLKTLATEPPQLAALAQVSTSGPVAPPCSCRLLSNQTLLWHHRLGHPSLPRLRGMHSRLLDLPVLHLHSDRGGEFSSNLLREFCRGEGILQSFTLPDSPQQNGIAERRIGLVMEVARTSMIHAAAPHFLWPFAVRYAAHQLNLWPRVSLPETSPTLRWTGEVGDASVFWVWGSRAFVRDTSTDKLFPRAIPSVFLGFVLDAPGWQFYHPTSRRVFPSQDVTFDEPVPFYHLFPYRSAPPPPPPLFLAPSPPPVDPLPPQGPAPSGVSQVDLLLGSAPVQVAVGSGAARGATTGGAASGGAEPRGAESEGAETGGAEPGGIETGGAEPEGVEPGGAASEGAESGGAEPQGAASSRGYAGASPRLSPQQLREWFVRRARLRSGATGAGGAGAAGDGGAGVAARAGVIGGTATTGPGGACTQGTGAAGTGGVEGAGAGDPTESGATGAGSSGAGGARAGGAGVGGTGARGAGVGGPGVGGAGAGGDGAVDPGGAVRPRPYFVPLLQQVLGTPSSTNLPPPLLCPPPDQSQPPLQPASPLPAPSSYTQQSGGLTERREPASDLVSPVRTTRRVPRSCPPLVPGTHAMTLRSSSVPLRVPLPATPESFLLEVPDPEFDCARAVSPTITRLLATAVTDPSFESAAASALVAELFDFSAACRLDYTTALVAESASASPPSVGGECALGMDVLEDRQEGFECLAAAVPRFASMLLAPDGDLDAPDIPTPHSYGSLLLSVAGSHGCRDGILEVHRHLRFSQRQGVDYFQTFSPTPKMTTLRVLLHVAAQRDYELHSLDFSTAFLQGSLHEEIWLRRLPGFTESFPAGTQWSLWRPVYGLRQAPREWHDTLRSTLAALGFALATADPSLFLRTDTSLSPFYVLVYVDDLVFATDDTEALTLVKWKLQKRHTCTDLGPLALPLPVLLATAHSSQLHLWPSPSSCEAEIYAGAMAAQELRFLTYLLTDLGEQPRLPPQHGQLRLAYVATRANTADIFTKALPPSDHQRFSTILGLVPTLPHLLTA
ncbi:unnamed protein product [Closterium sp. NIES-53]